MAEYRLSPPCQKCFLMLIAQKFFLHISHIFGQTLIFCAAIFPYKICLFLKVLSLGRVVDKLAKIIVVIKLLFCYSVIFISLGLNSFYIDATKVENSSHLLRFSYISRSRSSIMMKSKHECAVESDQIFFF